MYDALVFMAIFTSHMHDLRLVYVTTYSHFGFQSFYFFHCQKLLVKDLNTTEKCIQENYGAAKKFGPEGKS